MYSTKGLEAAVLPVDAGTLQTEDSYQDTVLVDMSHQIHTSMNGVIGMLALLRDTELTSSQRKLADMAQTSADNLLELLNQIVDFSSIAAGKLRLEHLPFDLLQEVTAVCNAQTAAAKNKGLELIVHTPATIRQLMVGDPVRIRQVVAQLVGHAIQFATQGQVRIDIETALEPDGHCRLHVSVTDSGSSAQRDHLARLFGQPDQTEAGTIYQYGATGLALVICKRLIELMGGQIGADSQPGHGSKYWFSLNLPCAPNVLAGVRVLLLDEQAATREALAEQLAQQSMRVDGYGTAAAALGAMEQAAAAQDPYRIAIFDHQMDGINAETLGAAIKADPAYRHTLLVISSPLTAAADALRFADAGFSAVISKPVSRQILFDTLSTLCVAIKNGKAPGFLNDALPGITDPSRPDTTPIFSGYRILVADDNLINQQTALQLLKKLGCRPDVAANGLEAIAMHGIRPYDLILMDCHMPKLDGYQTTARIRAAEVGCRRTPIVAWTACDLQDEWEKSMVAGMDDFMSKPIRPKVLQDMLGRWLAPVRAADSARPAADEHDELQAMQELFGANFAELIALFETDSPLRIKALYQAAAAGDHVQAAKIIHALSGSCASIGATRLSALCKELEIRFRAGLSDDAVFRLGAIETEYASVKDRLDLLLAASTGVLSQ